jgi:hypothetical protein
MSVFDDLSDYSYRMRGMTSAVRPAKNIGWLGFGSKFETGPSHPALSRALWEHSLISVNPARGRHICEFCKLSRANDAEREGKWISLGAAETRVISRGGTVYASPNLIYHYVLVHGYRPPDEFVDAAIGGIPPASEMYTSQLSALGLKWWPTPVLPDLPNRFRFVRTPNGVERIEE